jgi:hypothetical protein
MGEIIGVLVAEILKWIFISVLFDLVIKLPGYFIVVLFLKCRVRKLDSRSQRLRQREIPPDGLLSIGCGLLFWALIGAIGYRWYQTHN